MPWLFFLFTMLYTDSAPVTSDLRMIDELNDCVQIRFQAPPSEAFGMSRMLSPSSFDRHFVPRFNTTRDYEPENDREKTAVAALESSSLQVGFYLFGRAIADSSADLLNFRALKGPGAITTGTPRPARYPTAMNPMPQPDALPDWKAIYPLAQRAMKSFADGGSGFEMSFGSWRIAARPVVASHETCIACHDSPAARPRKPVVLNQAIGGVLYAFRRADSQSPLASALR